QEMDPTKDQAHPVCITDWHADHSKIPHDQYYGEPKSYGHRLHRTLKKFHSSPRSVYDHAVVCTVGAALLSSGPGPSSRNRYAINRSTVRQSSRTALAEVVNEARSS